MPAACIATSEPPSRLPMAMPTSAAASAGASFTPSPTMATTWPPRCTASRVAAPSSGWSVLGRPGAGSVRPSRSRCTTAALSPGSTSAITSPASARSPRVLAMASAAPRLSPDTMNRRRPCARSPASAAAAPGLGSSANASRASGAHSFAPSGPPSPCAASTDTVAPSSCNTCARSASGPRLAPSSPIQRRLPSASGAPFTVPRVPRPETACTSCAASTTTVRPRVAATSSTARASGCALCACSALAACSTASSSTPAAASITRSRGWPTVSVPVLSKATVSTRCAISSACASLIRMPCCAATPVPAMMAVGVARPSAQGQAITSTATACSSASSADAPA
ncbi:hypothetical protein FQZ97_759720 [compost metagenome]